MQPATPMGAYRTWQAHLLEESMPQSKEPRVLGTILSSGSLAEGVSGKKKSPIKGLADAAPQLFSCSALAVSYSPSPYSTLILLFSDLRHTKSIYFRHFRDFYDAYRRNHQWEWHFVTASYFIFRPCDSLVTGFALLCLALLTPFCKGEALRIRLTI